MNTAAAFAYVVDIEGNGFSRGMESRKEVVSILVVFVVTEFGKEQHAICDVIVDVTCGEVGT